MSDIKRPALISFNAHKVDDKKCKDNGKTIRILLTLPESNEDTCPEYNYKEELAAAKRKDKVVRHVKPVTNGLDPFDDNDDDVRRVVQEMEAKYGVSGPKKKRKGRKDDYADIGMGYDESDSFIDNTDGYDEMIPQNVTTLHGGFYINCGALEFKTDAEAISEVSSSSSSEDEDEEESEVKINKKRKIIDSTSESEGEKETDKELENVDKKPKIVNGTSSDEMKPKKKLLTTEKIKQIKKKKSEEKKKNTVRELLMEKREEENQSLPIPKPVDNLDTKEDRDSMKENKKPQMDNITDIIELVVKGVDDDLKSQECVEIKDMEKVNIIPSDGENSKDDEEKKVECEIIKLPENLPNEIVDIIEKIKDYASKNTETKHKFLSGPVCDTLLRLERKCKCLGKQSRMKIYGHLAPFVKCRKETLIRRAKNLVLEDDQKKIKSLISKLKDEINHIMPSLLDNYEKESQKIMQKKFSKETATNEDNKHLRMPKRRFSWTEDKKKLLKEIVSLKRRCFVIEGKNKDHLETLICTFLKADIQILWPEGWMSMTALQKICSIVLSGDAKKCPSSTPTVKNTTTNSQTQSSDTTHSKEIQKLASNTNLSIIPVTSVTQKPVNNSVDSVKSKSVNTSDITINKVDNRDFSPSKNKSLPEVIKTSNSLTITPTQTITLKTQCSERMKRIDFIEPNKENDLLIGDDKHSKQNIENNNVHHAKDSNKNKDGKSDASNKSDSSHCQIIDLTDTLTPDLKKKSSLKIKAKSYDGEKGGIKVKTDLMKPKHDKDEISGSFGENLADLIQQNMSKPTSSVMSHSNHGKTSENNKQYSTFCTTPPLDFQKMKQTTEGDEIHKAMESLKALQRLSSPAKATESLTSSPVSVIAYNKSYSPKSVLHNASSLPQSANVPSLRNEYKADFSSGFQEVFQRQFLNDFTLMQNSVNHSAPTSSKSHYNSSEKYTHSSDSYLNDKHYSSANNFPQSNTGKVKNHNPQQPGSYNILDDMLANFLNEYGFPKAAGHIPKQPQK